MFLKLNAAVHIPISSSIRIESEDWNILRSLLRIGIPGEAIFKLLLRAGGKLTAGSPFSYCLFRERGTDFPQSSTAIRDLILAKRVQTIERPQGEYVHKRDKFKSECGRDTSVNPSSSDPLNP